MDCVIVVRGRNFGGGEVQTLKLAERLRARGCASTILQWPNGVASEAFSEAVRSGGFPLVRVDGRTNGRGVRGWARVLESLPRGIWVNATCTFERGSLALDFAAQLRFRRRIAIQHSMPGLDAWHSGRHGWGLLPGVGLEWHWRRSKGWLRQFLLQTIVCDSEAIRDALRRQYWFPPGQLRTVHNGIDPQRFQFGRMFREEWRQRWRIPPGAAVLGAVGRLSAEKNFLSAMKTMQRLASDHPDLSVHLVLVGEGPETARLQAFAEQAGVSSRVTFGGWIPSPWEAYSTFDVFVMPSLTEGLPLSLCEAMSCQCCCVATDVGGVSEVLSRPDIGWLVPPADQDAFDQAVLEAVKLTADRRQAIGRAAREHIVRHFDENVLLDQLVDVILDRTRSPNGPGKHVGQVRHPMETP